MKLELHDVRVGYCGKALLSAFSLDVAEGEIVSIIGPNGAGKSTILKSIIRQLPVLDGTVLLAGKSLYSYSWQELAREMAVLLTAAVKPELMTCREVAAAGRYPYTGRLGLLSGNDEALVEKALSAVQADSFADARFSEVSDGQRQRVLLARALCQEPRILVLDEPTSYLDIRYRLKLLSVLRELSSRGVSIIMSLHEVELAQKVSDKILCVGHGSCTLVSPEELSRQDKVSVLYDLGEGYYDALLGFSELPRVEGRAEVFVLSAAGTGIPVYRSLQRRGIPFAAGILYTNDIDYRVAQALAVAVAAEEPFCEIGDEAYRRACELVDSCGRVLDAGVAGLTAASCNRRILDLRRYAGEKLCTRI